MNVDQYGQIYFKNKMVNFVIDKNVQYGTIIIIVQRHSLCGDASQTCDTSEMTNREIFFSK